ncbi:Store-operated calcium entry-associated regulatory factor [Boothiomyces macroporosus]|uniref:Store-operated calcium entry-associated regulatory factor n=1 Tax=Boothiomyces macroporosus TaxID=261099 RepID=A0AAD5UI48_9FUNG|nr:Store-operated calcium entry-associated regulatory factor [Boothiomyces macroporosus]
MLFLLILEATARHQKVLLKDIQTLTLYNGKYTTGQRSSAVPQLKCVGGDACRYKEYQPEIMQCENRGFDGRDYQWKCTSELDEKVKLRDTTVTCEGYSYADDPYVLVGSCGVEYTLYKTSKFNQPSYNTYQDHDYQPKKTTHTGFSIFKPIKSFIGFLLSLFIIFVIFSFFNSLIRNLFGSTNSGDGGTGGNDGGSGGPGGYYKETHSNQRPWYDSFWPGFGAGNLFNWWFNSRNNNTYYSRPAYTYERPRPTTTEYTSTSYTTTRESTGFGGTTRRGTSSSSESNSGTRQSTGYGGTKRR